VKRFLLTPDAENDLGDSRAYLNSIPIDPAERIAQAIFETLGSIAEFPFQGPAHSHYTSLFGREIRSRFVNPYRIFYSFVDPVPEVIAILHGARNQATIIAQCV
jgi:plasmid stabilization system protein ParE